MAVKFAKVVAGKLSFAMVLGAADVLLLGRRHWRRLEPPERRRLITLVRQSHGRSRNLSQAEREELSQLVAKADPRLFAGTVAQRFSPVPLPRRIVQGKR